jgi:hypothetical protein
MLNFEFSFDKQITLLLLGCFVGQIGTIATKTSEVLVLAYKVEL